MSLQLRSVALQLVLALVQLHKDGDLRAQDGRHDGGEHEVHGPELITAAQVRLSLLEGCHENDRGLELGAVDFVRSEEHTSELQSRLHLVCRLLLEKKKNMTTVGHPYPP